MKDNTNIVREGGFLFNLCSVVGIHNKDDKDFFCRFADILVVNIVEYLHNHIFNSKKYDLEKKDDRNKIMKMIFDNVLFRFNNMHPHIFPYRVAIEDCAVVEVHHGCGTIITDDNEFKMKISEAEVIKHIFMAIQKKDTNRFKKSIERSELLIFDLVIFTKYAPLAVINGKTGESIFPLEPISDWQTGNPPTSTDDPKDNYYYPQEDEDDDYWDEDWDDDDEDDDEDDK